MVDYKLKKSRNPETIEEEQLSPDKTVVTINNEDGDTVISSPSILPMFPEISKS